VIDFEWDTNKAAANLGKHGVSFSEASSVFADPFELTISDPDHSEGEYRFLSIGKTARNHLVVVVFTERLPNVIRIISARIASRKEGKKDSFMSQESSDDMRSEYDFSNAVQGKHHRAYAQGTNVVLLDPDVARVYRDSESVNKALRLLMELARNQTSGSAQPEQQPEGTLPSRR